MEKPTKSEQELKAIRERVEDPKVKDAISKKLKYINKPVNK